MTKTLLEAVNELLLIVGELDVATLTSPVARKAVVAIQRGISAVSDLHRWSYLEATVVPSSVSGNVLTLLFPNSRIRFVSFSQTVLSEEPEPRIYAAIATSPATGWPRVFARLSESTVLIYPTIVPADLSKFSLKVNQLPILPIIATDVITLPDSVYNCVQLHAEVIMHRIHTGDMEALNAAQAEFETKLHYARTLDGNGGII